MFTIRTRPRLFIASRVLDAIDANPVLAVACIVAAIAGTLLLIVFAFQEPNSRTGFNVDGTPTSATAVEFRALVAEGGSL